MIRLKFSLETSITLFYIFSFWTDGFVNGAVVFELDDDYNKFEPPPPTKGSSILTVSVSVDVREVLELIERNSEVVLVLFWKIFWIDPRIILPEENEVNKSWPVTINIELKDKLWIPDIALQNVKDYHKLQMEQNLQNLRVYRNKTFRYKIGSQIAFICPMDFNKYPHDSHICNLDFTSFSLREKSLSLHWHKNELVFFWPSWNRLGNYIVDIKPDLETKRVNYGFSTYSVARLIIKFHRRVWPFVLKEYIPSAGFVIISWISFLVPPNAVPGRMVLLVTTLLSLITMFDSSRNTSPETTNIKYLDIWLMTSILFVFSALLEYAFVLLVNQSNIQLTVFYNSGPKSSQLRSMWRRKISLVVNGITAKIRRDKSALPKWKGGITHHTRNITTRGRLVSNVIHPDVSLKPATSSAVETPQHNLSAFFKTIDHKAIVIFPIAYLIFVIAFCCSS